MFLFVSERSSHAAATGIGVADHRARYSLQQLVRPTTTIQCFLVAVTMDDETPFFCVRFRWLPVEFDLACCQFLFKEGVDLAT